MLRLKSLLSHFSDNSVKMEQPNGGRPLTPPVDTNGHQEETVQDGQPSTYTLLPQWHSKPSHVRVIHVGAGAAGILMAYKMQKTMSNYELVCYEKYVGTNPHILPIPTADPLLEIHKWVEHGL